MENCVVFDVGRVYVILDIGVIDGLIIRFEGLGLVFEELNVVFIFVGVEGDLLLFVFCWVYERVRVEVVVLGVDMVNGNVVIKDDIGGNIFYGFSIESGLEFRIYEVIFVIGVDKVDEVDGEYG